MKTLLLISLLFISTLVSAQLNVTSSGKVGIGTETPDNPLEISWGNFGSFSPSGTPNSILTELRIGFSNTKHAKIIAMNGGNSDHQELLFKTYAGAYNTAMYMNSWGKVGIGTTSIAYGTSYKLHVVGGISCDYGTYGSFWVYSDKKLKKDIEKIKSPLERLQNINGYSYKLRSASKTNSNQAAGFEMAESSLGVIAQEIEKEFPELVMNDNESKAVNYLGLIPVLIESIKQQQEQIKELQTKLESISIDYEMDISSNNKILIDHGTMMLSQNKPNPFRNSTIIHYSIPNDFSSAYILVVDMNGTKVMKVEIFSKGQGSFNISSGDINRGVFFYTLVVDGKEIDRKKMVFTN